MFALNLKITQMEITDKEIVDILYKHFHNIYDKIIEYIETEDRINNTK